MSDIMQAIRYGTNIFPRSILALASTLYCIFSLLGPTYPTPSDLALAEAANSSIFNGQIAHFSTLQMLIVAFIFGLNAVLLWWRIFDSHARLWPARLINYFTACLWVTVTGATIYAYGWLLPSCVGEIMLALISLHALTRTDYTTRDRETA
jgi:hypothetical protein